MEGNVYQLKNQGRLRPSKNPKNMFGHSPYFLRRLRHSKLHLYNQVYSVLLHFKLCFLSNDALVKIVKKHVDAKKNRCYKWSFSIRTPNKIFHKHISRLKWGEWPAQKSRRWPKFPENEFYGKGGFLNHSTARYLTIFGLNSK